jgi:hypothetical protein
MLQRIAEQIRQDLRQPLDIPLPAQIAVRAQDDAAARTRDLEFLDDATADSGRSRRRPPESLNASSVSCVA